MEKLSVVAQAEKRAELYNVAESALVDAGYETETIKGGMLVKFEGGYAVLSVTIKNPEKFDLADVRAEYQEALQKAAERAEKAAAKATEKAAKAAEKAAKEQAVDA